MKKLSLSFAAAIALLVFAYPAVAAPPQCEVSCTCQSRCNKPCSFGAYISTCGGYQTCVGADLCLLAAAGQATDTLDGQWAAIVAEPGASPAAQDIVCQATVDAR